MSGAPDFSAQPLRFLHAYWRCWQTLTAGAETQLERTHGLDLRAFLALSFLQGGAAHPGELAAQLGVPRYVMTRTLDLLSRLHAVERGPDGSDRRRQHVRVTAAGQRLWQAALQTVQRVSGAPLAVLGDQLGPVSGALERLAAAATEAAATESAASHAQETRP